MTIVEGVVEIFYGHDSSCSSKKYRKLLLNRNTNVQMINRKASIKCKKALKRNKTSCLIVYQNSLMTIF